MMVHALSPAILPCIAVSLLMSCGAPPLMQYVFSGGASSAAPASLDPRTTVIEVARIRLPDYLDTDEIIVRRGSSLETSHRGRWASRLSVLATGRLTERLAQRRPDLLITDAPQTATPAYRLLVNISCLDLTVDGTALLAADWLIQPRNPAAPMLRDRGQFEATGSAAADNDVVALEQNVLDQLAAAINITRLE